MKGLIGLGVVGLIACAITIWMQTSAQKDQGIPVAIAFGTAPSGQYEMHIAVDIGMVQTEGPPTAKDFTPLWDPWMNQHFTLEDSKGQPVRLVRANNSRLLRKVAGTPEFFVTAGIKPGADYTVYYIPRTAEPKKYRYKFNVPPEGKEGTRTYFLPM